MAIKTLEPLTVTKGEYNEILEEIHERQQPSHQRQYSEAYIRTVKRVIARQNNRKRRQLDVSALMSLHK
ncbi:hypothetical protein CN277_11130 [Bacillus cereus]|uniref:hypothetical protein n=1 Tax=Bacillus cereus TaxID=1396 RepID=UPI000BECBA48|nr:hypothetical protein [Bacillus cereus]PEE56854.1 hypothetical protein COM68_22225 [Bacillus cereus]PFC62511.1 hypothetical protein CN267_08600 [Bacillus cereus]PFD02795.1 hypothetical protein CN277_11130 [Bacillus cereus]